MARVRKPGTTLKKSTGLGDTIEKITTATGIKALVEFVAGEDCGCEERKELLNKLFPYSKPNCLTEDEHVYLKAFFEENPHHIKPSTQTELLQIYNRVFNNNQMPTSCADCWRQMISELRQIFSEYEN